MTIIEQTITLSVGEVKEIVRKLVLAGLLSPLDDPKDKEADAEKKKLRDEDNATFSLKIVERGNAEIIFPFPNCLSIIEPVNDANGH